MALSSSPDPLFRTGFLNPARRRRHLQLPEDRIRHGQRLALCGAGADVWLDRDYLTLWPVLGDHFTCLNCARALQKLLPLMILSGPPSRDFESFPEIDLGDPATLRAQIRKNAELVVRLSRTDCHLQGLHSLVVDQDDQGRLRRIFFTTPYSQLQEDDGEADRAFPPLRLSAHDHRYALQLTMLRGTMKHWILRPGSFGTGPKEGHKLWTKQFRYQSPLIAGQQGAFRETGSATFHLEDFRVLSRHSFNGPRLVLPASVIHSVATVEHFVAWEVQEGRPARSYKGFAYSNENLEAFAFDKHYGTLDLAGWEKLLTQVGLL